MNLKKFINKDSYKIRKSRIRVGRIFLVLGMISGMISTLSSLYLGMYEMAMAGTATFIISPAILWLSYRPKLEYLPIIFSVLVTLGFSAGNACTELYHAEALIWLGVVPLMYFYLTNRFIGSILSAFTFFLYLFGYLFFEQLTGTAPMPAGSMGQGMAVYFYSIFLSWLFESEWTGIERNLVQDSDHDYLTGIFNRRAIVRQLENQIANSFRRNDSFSIILFDIDNFKNINDTYGHEIGDSVLKEMTVTVAENIRAEDVFGRWGGEEFVILCKSEEDGKILAEKICRDLSSHSFRHIKNLSASFGVAKYRKQETVSEIIDRADGFLYDAKKKKGCVRSEDT
ncbi:MAG: GGDEF domain-containing protein [Spirochaetia bacterium]|nr:GGDEF domain-containing protein [Spirochaetia bacterium]